MTTEMTTEMKIAETLKSMLTDRAPKTAHRWTSCQLDHLRATAHLSIDRAVRSMRHRFGARLANVSDTAIRGKRFHLRNPTKQAQQNERRRVRSAFPFLPAL